MTKKHAHLSPRGKYSENTGGKKLLKRILA
jgi:hypothetical protein